MRASRALLGTLWLIGLAACGARGAQVEQASDAGPQLVHLEGFEGGAGPLDALTRRFGKLRTRLAERGYGEEVGLTRRFALERQGVAVPVSLLAGRCTTFVALGGQGIRDLEMHIYDRDGVPIAQDIVPREGALAHVCPPAEPPELSDSERALADPSAGTVPFYVEFVSLRGDGAFVAGAYQSLPGEGEGFEGLFDRALRPSGSFDALEAELAREKVTLRARGFRPNGSPHFANLAEGQSTRAEVRMQSGRCYLLLSVATESLSELDLYLFDPAGTETARQLEGQTGGLLRGRLRHCARTSGTYAVEARAFSGLGSLGFQVLRGKGEVAQLPTSTPRPTSVEVAKSVLKVAAGSQLGVFADRLVRVGFDEPEFLAQGQSAGPGDERSHQVLLPRGCTVVAGTSLDGDLDLDLYVENARGQIIDHDTGFDAVARVSVCLSAAATHRVIVKGYGRQGRYDLALLKAPAALSNLRAVRLTEARAALLARGYEEQSREEGALSTGGKLVRTTLLRPGTCVGYAAAAEARGADLDLLLRDNEGKVLVSATGPEAFGAVGRCAAASDDQTSRVPQRLTLEVVMYRGEGDVGLSMLTRGRERPETPMDALPPTTPPAAPTLPTKNAPPKGRGVR